MPCGRHINIVTCKYLYRDDVKNITIKHQHPPKKIEIEKCEQKCDGFKVKYAFILKVLMNRK